MVMIMPYTRVISISRATVRLDSHEDEVVEPNGHYAILLNGSRFAAVYADTCLQIRR